MRTDDRHLISAVREAAEPLDDDAALDRLADELSAKRLILLGEASHGTADFYRLRRQLSQRLIEHYGYAGVVAEADWPDALAVTRYAKGASEARTAEDALETFQRFPTWMWRNPEVAELADWLRDYNTRTDGPGAGFYGMDLYSLHASMREVIRFLETVDPKEAAAAKERYACFDRYGPDAQSYGRAAAYQTEHCEDLAVEQLLKLQQRRARELPGDDADTAFYAEQNARLVKNAERYYRSMYRGRASSWNLRDTHMADTVEALLDHLARTGQSARLILWAHNSHLGDASATDMANQGELNVGQLLRERYPEEVALVGLTTYTGTVTAAHDWDEPAQRMNVRKALPDSVEDVLHQVDVPRYWLNLTDLSEGLSGLREPRLERFIGVIYRPLTERHSHYFDAKLADQYDYVVHLDETEALRPLAEEPTWEAEAPETYPSGM